MFILMFLFNKIFGSYDRRNKKYAIFLYQPFYMICFMVQYLKTKEATK